MKFIRPGWYLPLALLVAAGMSWGQQYPNQQQQPMQQPGQQQPGQMQQPGQQPGQMQQPGQQPGQPSATSDTQLQSQVQSAIDANPELKAAGVTATVTNGQVTLMGVVSNDALRQQAKSAASSVSGVTGVQDLITVSPSAATPQQQTQPGQEQQAQPAQPPAQPSAQPGQPAGTPPASQPGQEQQPGQQPTQPAQPPAQPSAQPQAQPPAAQPSETPQQEQQEEQQEQQEETQEQQPGQQPQAQQPSGQPAGSAASLQSQVTSALMNDPQLGKYAVSASVNDKNDVTLTGTVPTKEDKKRAKSVAENISGVHKVHNKIQVNPSVAPMQPSSQQPPSGQQPPSEQQPQSANEPPSQAAPGTAAPVTQEQQQTNPATGEQSAEVTQQIQQQLSQALQSDPELSKYNVSGLVTGTGKVTLQGVVPSEADKKHAETLAKGISGVSSVDNKLTVNPSATPSAQPAQQPPSEQPPSTQPPSSQPPMGGGLAWNHQGQLSGQQAGQQPSGQAAANPAAPQDEQTQLENALKNDPALSGVTPAVSGNTVTLTGTVASKADKQRAERVVKTTAPKGTKIHNKIKVQKTGASGGQTPSGAPPLW